MGRKGEHYREEFDFTIEEEKLTIMIWSVLVLGCNTGCYQCFFPRFFKSAGHEVDLVLQKEMFLSQISGF